MKKLMIMAFGLALLGAVQADDYQYYISGYPAEDARQSCTTEVSSVTTGTLGFKVEFDELEARFRDFCDAELDRFNSYPPTGCFIIVR